MRKLPQLFENNRNWAREMTDRDPEFFNRLSTKQAPKFLWIGCADSRVPANQITGLDPGEVFVHRNIANVVVNSDINCLSVVQYAVEVLEVTDIIVCGHYGCGGVKAALEHKPYGLIDNWLRHIKDVARGAHDELAELSGEARVDRLVELNIRAQVANLAATTIVQGAWSRGKELSVHGWVYSIKDGLLRDLGLLVEKPEQVPDLYRMNAS